MEMKQPLLLLIMVWLAFLSHSLATVDATFSRALRSELHRSKTILSFDDELIRAEEKSITIRVSKDGNGDFKTVQEAVDSVPMGNGRRTVIRIGPGVYHEKVKVDRTKPFLTFYGEADAMPTITFNSTAKEYGTWESATVAVESPYFVACNVIFENSAPKPRPGVEGAQAVALRISGDKAAFYNCKFYGYQDTLCDDKGNHFFKDCLIRGTEDFIFGNARSLYSKCVIESLSTSGVTAITAQARMKTTDESGFSFVHCIITGTGSGSAYLGRAWRPSGRVVFSYTYMGNLVHPQGWDDKGDISTHKTVYYAEYKCIGPGSSTNDRVSYGRILTDKEARPFLTTSFINGSTWILPPPS